MDSTLNALRDELVHDSPLRSPTTSTFSSRYHRDRVHDPSVSMLEFDDDPRLSVVSGADNNEHPTLDDSSRRLSYLGPNLRFHSPAPWEIDDATLNDEEHHYPFLQSSKKAFGFSSSPRTSNVHRPSGESTRSQGKSKQSFDTVSSQASHPRGALYALAQESLSTSSLGSAHKPLRSKFTRSDAFNNTTPQSLNHAAHSNHTPLTSDGVPISQLQSTSYHRDAENFHPYANPDLDEARYSPPRTEISRSDSVATVTESLAHSVLSRADTRATLAPASSMSIKTGSHASAIQGKDISSPISTFHSLRRDSPSHAAEEPFQIHPQPNPEHFPGWTGHVTSPGFSLISLEEARARKRSATTQPIAFTSPSTVSIRSTDTCSPVDASHYMRYEFDDDGGISPRQQTRARSSSAGAKAIDTLQNAAGIGRPKVEADPGHGKTLKHRKSAFLRLFNGGRVQDKEDKSPPPPVPPLLHVYAARNVPQVALQHDWHPPSALSWETTSVSSRQTPPPKDLQVVTARPTTSPRRLPPPLSINTQPRNNHRLANINDFQTHTAPSTSVPHPWLTDAPPQSAPANVSEFPLLSLRPVSTVFSFQFGEHVLPDSRLSLETDVETPGSSTRVFSPVTPGSASLPAGSNTDSKPGVLTSVSDDQMPIVSVLRDQLLDEKLAWQRQIVDLESQVRNLQSEVDELRKGNCEGFFCETCGRGRLQPGAQSSPNQPIGLIRDTQNLGIIDRPRARTGTTSRFVNVLS